MARTSLIFDILANDRASSVFRGVGKSMGVLGIGLAGIGIAGFTKSVIDSGAAFDKTLRQMGAIAQVPAAGIKDMSKLALQLGKDTSFSAQEAADAMLELAKGGITSAQIKAGALKETLTLAAAGGIGLADAATYMSNALNGFGIKADQAGRVSAALAGGANASTASVESLGMALGQVGPGAVSAGLSLETTVAALAAFDQAGIKGSDAGTSLKTFLSRLVPQTKAARQAFDDLNLKTTDANGNFLSLATISQRLQNGLKGMSDEERTAALNRAFGSDATRAALVLAKNGAKGIDEYTKATSDGDAANRVAQASMQGLSGALERLSGTWDTIKTQLGMAIAPAVTAVANGLAGLYPWFEKIGGAAKVFGSALSGNSDVGKFTGKLEAVNKVGIKLREIWVTRVVPAFHQFVDYFRAQVIPAVQDFARRAMAGLRSAFDTISRKIQENRPQLEQLVTGFKMLAQFIVEKVVPILGSVLGARFRMMGKIIGTGIQVVSRLVDAFNAIKGPVGEALGFLVHAFLDTVDTIVSGAARAFGWVPGLGGKLKAAATAVGAFKDKVNAELAALTQAKVIKVDLVVNGINTLNGALAKLDRLDRGTARVVTSPAARMSTAGVTPGRTARSVGGSTTNVIIGGKTVASVVEKRQAGRAARGARVVGVY